MEQEAQWYLVEQLSQARAMAGLDNIAERRAGILAHFGGSLEAFRYLNAMSHDEINEWNRKMLVALGIALPEPPRPGVAQAVWVGPGDPPPPYTPPPPSRFVGQVLGPDREFEVFGGRLRVLAAEIYHDGVVFRWRVAPEPDIRAAFPEEMAAVDRDVDGVDDWAADHLRSKAEAELRMRRLYRFDLHDDVGTDYHSEGGGHGGGANEMEGRTKFTPTPPPAAIKVVLGWLGAAIEVRLA